METKDAKVNKRAEQIECLECLKMTNKMLESEIQIEMAELENFCGDFGKSNGTKTPVDNSLP